MPYPLPHLRLQQQTPRSQNRQQQQSSGIPEFQPRQSQQGGSSGASQMGEGGFENSSRLAKQAPVPTSVLSRRPVP